MALQITMRFVGDPVTGDLLNIYAIIHGADATVGAGQTWNRADGVWEATNNSSWGPVNDKYANVLAEAGSGIYSAEIPAALRIPNRVYDISYYQRNGGVPSPTADALVGAATLVTGDNRLELVAIGAPTCVVANDTVSFVVTLQDNDGQVAPNATPTTVVTGGGSAVVAAIAGTTGSFRVTYTAPATVGAEVDVAVAAAKTYGSATVNRKITVPIKVCEVGTAPATPTQISDAVWSALRSGNSASVAWAIGSFGQSVSLQANGIANDTFLAAQFAADFGTEVGKAVWVDTGTRTITGTIVGAITNQSFALDAIDANALGGTALTEITTGVNNVLTSDHGAGSWGGGGGGGNIQISSE